MEITMRTIELEQMDIIKPEILAPAGSMDVLKSAIQSGCDAVYLGGSQFGARAFAGNFDTQELLDAISYAHQKGCLVYLTVNTLCKQKEIEQELESYLLPFYTAGLDAVIVQDMGVLQKIHNRFPDLPIHISTQAGIMSEEGALLMQASGASRIVPARELSLEEIATLTAIPNLEIECFVHGALCYCYSGHCLLSSSIGSRSGNRGRCAQPCRLPYEVTFSNEKTQSSIYALSPKDMCAIQQLPELLIAGIHSFKIEGRMKKAEYVSVVSMLYCKYRDLARECLYDSMKYFHLQNIKQVRNLEPDRKAAFLTDVYNRYQVTENDMMLLLQMYNRGGFTPGYYQMRNGKEMMALQRPNHHGVYMGKIEGIGKGTVSFTLQQDLFPKDVLEIRVKEDTIEMTSPIAGCKGQRVTLNASKLKKIKTGQEVYRMKSPYWIDTMQQKQMQLDTALKVTIKLQCIPDQPVICSIWETSDAESSAITLTGDMVQKAQKAPITKESIHKALCQTGGTGVTVNETIILLQGDCFLSMKSIKDIRRQAIEAVLAQKEHTFLRQDNTPGAAKELIHTTDDNMTNEIAYVVSVRQVEQWQWSINNPFLSAIYVDCTLLCHSIFRQQLKSYQGSANIYFILPKMFRKDVIAKLEKDTLLSHFDGFLIQTLDSLHWVVKYASQQKKQYKIVLDSALYVYNQEAFAYYYNYLTKQPYITLSGITCPQEETLQEIADSRLPFLQITVYGKKVVMTSAQCLVKNTKGCYHKKQKLQLTDRKGKSYLVYNNCDFCMNQILEQEPLCMLGMAKDIFAIHPHAVRFDFTEEPPEEMQHILTLFMEEYEEGTVHYAKMGNTGHYYHPVD